MSVNPAEINLYYLNSRYYDSNTGRFINADGVYDIKMGLFSHNMYLYCENNPTNRFDSTGQCWHRLWLWDCPKCKEKKSSVTVQPEAPSIEPYGTYTNGNVYIVPETELGTVQSIVNKKDVIIVDKRSSEDPNMQVQKSYRITSKTQKEEIAQIMLDYNIANPVDPEWIRTKSSIVTEWTLHNLAYYVGYKRERTADTDLNNADEGMGLWDFVRR